VPIFSPISSEKRLEKIDILTLDLDISQSHPHQLIMAKATWNGVILAQSDRTIVVENNYYFPPDSIDRQYFTDSNTHTTCGWKGLCSYYNVEVNGQVNKDAAWYYPTPKEAAQNIAGYVAFWKGVKVEP
jgi:uncharacterized protein (DUF427 family)